MPFDNRQDLLTLNFTIDTTATFGVGLGAISMYGFNFAPRGELDTGGQRLDISTNGSLDALIGDIYGLSTAVDFVLPDFDDAVLIGQGQGPGLTSYSVGQSTGSNQTNINLASMPATTGGLGVAVDNHQSSVVVTYAIRTQGTYPSRSYIADEEIQAVDASGFLAEVRAFAMEPDDLPNGWVAAEGQFMSIAANSALFSLLGITYGGDGRTTFNLPDLRGRAVMGAGDQPGGPIIRLGSTQGTETFSVTENNIPSLAGGGGQTIDNEQPTLALNYLVALQGIFPSRSYIAAEPGFETIGPVLGEVIMFAGNFAPRGFAFANGQLLSIAQNTALFSLYGNQFGGDGRSTFALPDLRGRVAIDEGSQNNHADVGNGSVLNLQSADLPVGYALANDDTYNIVDGYVLGSGGESLLVANGSGVDSGNGTLFVGRVNGVAAAVNTEITLASGAKLTVIADGTFSYSVVGSSLEALSEGQTAQDSFTYSLGFGGVSTATVTINITGDEHELIIGQAVADSLSGGTGDDTILGNEGGDYLSGDVGNDTLFGGINEDSLFGGDGNDLLGGGGSNDYAEGGDNDDTLRGGGGDDQLLGDQGNDTLEGGSGDDTLFGGTGDDRIVGAKGHDTIDGGEGNDILIGSAGHDLFVFTGDFGNDTIMDFAEMNAYEDIDLSGVLGIGSYGDLVANHMTQVGNDVVIIDGANSITVLNALLADMNYADFVF